MLPGEADDSSLLCPSCRERPALSPAAGPLGALRCPLCRGALLPPRGTAALRALVGPAAAALAGTLSARSTACPSCSGATPFVALAAGFASACTGCATVWVDADLLAWAEARSRLRAAGPPPPSATPVPAPPPGAPAPALPAGTQPSTSTLPPAPIDAPPPLPPLEPRASTLLLRRVVKVAAAAAMLAAVAWYFMLRLDAWLVTPGEAPSHHLTSPLARAVDAKPRLRWGAEPEAQVPAEERITRRPEKPAQAEVRVAGRTLEWWQKRLELLRASPDASRQALYQATLGRARAGGLEVTDDGSAVTVKPGPAQLASTGAAP